MNIVPMRTWQAPTVKPPTLQDLLDDPTTQSIMESDGLRREDLIRLLAEVRRRLAGTRAGRTAR